MVVKAFVIGYRNHAGRVIEHLASSGLCDEIFIFHPKKLLDTASQKLGVLVTPTNNFFDVVKCSCVFICSPSKTHVQY